jgi:hypothetical protein
VHLVCFTLEIPLTYLIDPRLRTPGVEKKENDYKGKKGKENKQVTEEELKH